MKEIFAQGDLLIERVPDVVPSGRIAQNSDGAAMVLAEGEADRPPPRDMGACDHVPRRRLGAGHTR